MFKVCWDKEINGVLLCQSCDEPLNISPRPVFREELDILGFDRYWKYPQDSKSPLLWALGRRYFYKGIWVAEAKGGNLFEAPEIIITEDGKNLTLQPIDTRKLIEKNKEALFILENEAIDFVLDTYTKYKNRVDFIAVAFSGGKDSQVVLDIVSRVLPPDEFIVVFSDTTMELPHTYEIVEHTKKEYQKKYPTLKFYTVKPPKSAIEFWEDFGPPSRIHRWCCTVIKTAPFVNFIRELYHEKGGKKVPKILVFDGVRAEESPVRRGYAKVSLNAKSIRQINASTLQLWNTTEVLLYIFYRELILNQFYKKGLERVGCSICPFSSSKTEFVIRKLFPQLIDRFLSIIEKMCINKLGNDNSNIVNEYIREGQWKKRAGGRDLLLEEKIIYDFFKDKVVAKVRQFNLERFSEFIKIIGNVSSYQTNDGKNLHFRIHTDSKFIDIDVTQRDKEYMLVINNSSNHAINLIKKILNKSVFCVACRGCEILCSQNALIMHPAISIRNCIHCLKCLSIEKGCYMAKSLNITENNIQIIKRGKEVEKITNNRYQTFGLKEEWFNLFMENPQRFLEDIKLASHVTGSKSKGTFNAKTGLGLYQIISMSVWLRETEILNDKRQLNNQFFLLISYLWPFYKKTIWEIMITNLYFNSKIFRWYLDTFPWNYQISREELEKRLIEEDKAASARSVTNDLTAFLKTLSASPIGNELYLGKIVDEKQKIIKKEGTSDVTNLGIYYNLLKTSTVLNSSKFRLSQLYDPDFVGGPYKVFGIRKADLVPKIISIQEKNSKLLRVEFTADLDNINLNEVNIETNFQDLRSLI